jgi:hypothetical protein
MLLVVLQMVYCFHTIAQETNTESSKYFDLMNLYACAQVIYAAFCSVSEQFDQGQKVYKNFSLFQKYGTKLVIM